MTDQNPVPSERSADRLEIVNLIDAWARCADRRRPQEQAALFAPDGRITVQMADPSSSEPVQTLQGHAELAEAFKVLETYDATTHFNGQSTITLDGDHATGESYCLAHHIWVEDGQRMLMIMAIRYHDTFIRQDGRWLFVHRELITDWIDKRSSSA